ncbi:MAG: Crp/Fnr family transcriptional regulator [Chlorobi bacterium]|nr:Crp/Fnr family transcriptional regulator [Chlorobiota bacterium]
MVEIKKLFYKAFNKYATVPLEVLEVIFPLFDIYTIEKGREIITQGKINSNEYFILNGLLREFIIDEYGKEITLDFYFGTSIIIPNFFRTKNNRSILSVQLLTNSIIAEIDATVFANVRNEHNALKEFSSSVITNCYKSRLHKQIFHASESGKEKLEQLRKDFPGIENQVPMQYIASYLGITNVSLSRLRSRK